MLQRVETPRQLSGHAAWEIADLLRLEVLWHSDDAYLHGLLVGYGQDTRRADWLAHFPESELNRLLATYNDGHFKGNSARLEVQHYLTHLYQFEIDEYRRDRATAELRGIYLGRLVLVLLVLLLAFAWLYALDAGDFRVAFLTMELSGGPEESSGVRILLVMLAGAVGSVLSRAVKIGNQQAENDTRRAMPVGIRALTAAWKVSLAQPIIGATAALVVYIVLLTGLLSVAGLASDKISAVALVAFLSGFSEPFFIGTLDRITRFGNDTEPNSVSR
jgi:hypothetical protein